MARKIILKATEFILSGRADSIGVTDYPICLFLWIYTLLTAVGNVGIDSQLHTPMYFSWLNWVSCGCCCSSTITQRERVDLLSEKKSISFAGCFLWCGFHRLITTECILLGSRPMTAMWPYNLSFTLDHVQDGLPENGSVGLTAGLLNSAEHQLCKQLAILQFQYHPSLLCDSPHFKLSCSDTRLHESTFVHILLVWIRLALLVILTYCYILFSIFRMHAGEEAQSLSTCAVSPDSHHAVLFHLHLHLVSDLLQLLPGLRTKWLLVLHSIISCWTLWSTASGISKDGFMECNYQESGPFTSGIVCEFSFK